MTQRGPMAGSAPRRMTVGCQKSRRLVRCEHVINLSKVVPATYCKLQACGLARFIPHSRWSFVLDSDHDVWAYRNVSTCPSEILPSNKCVLTAGLNAADLSTLILEHSRALLRMADFQDLRMRCQMALVAPITLLSPAVLRVLSALPLVPQSPLARQTHLHRQQSCASSPHVSSDSPFA